MEDRSKIESCPGCNNLNPLRTTSLDKIVGCVRGHRFRVTQTKLVCSETPDEGCKLDAEFNRSEDKEFGNPL